MLGFRLRPLVIAVHALNRGDQKLVISSFPSVCSYPGERDARTRDSLCLGFLQASAESRGKHSALSSFMFPYPSPSFSFLSHPLFSLFPPSSLSFFNLKNVLSIFTVIRCV